MKDHYSHGNGNILPFDENKINQMINKHSHLKAKAQRKIEDMELYLSNKIQLRLLDSDNLIILVNDIRKFE
jgi:hypothetical protein